MLLNIMGSVEAGGHRHKIIDGSRELTNCDAIVLARFAYHIDAGSAIGDMHIVY